MQGKTIRETREGNLPGDPNSNVVVRTISYTGGNLREAVIRRGDLQILPEGILLHGDKLVFIPHHRVYMIEDE